MARILWLAYERLPHPDAVTHPAGEDDARLVLELLAHPYPKRLQLAEQLGNFLKQQDALPAFSRNRVPCRRASGLYHPISWRFAKWLSHVLPAEDAVILKTSTRIRNWLNSGGREPFEAGRSQALPCAQSSHNILDIRPPERRIVFAVQD